jgi:hypothetical protein
MRCKYCGYDVDVTHWLNRFLDEYRIDSPSDRELLNNCEQQFIIQGACGVCAMIAQGLTKRTITSATVKRILDATRPEEAWKATWGKF